VTEMVFLMPSARGQGHLFELYRASDGLREVIVCTSRNDVKDRLPEFDMVSLNDSLTTSGEGGVTD
jgi:hypothetical protein